jgi:hypothetical protein
LHVESPGFSILLHDPCGLRRVFFSERSCPVRFCASEAITAAKLFGLEKNPAAVKGFEQTDFVRKGAEYWWPGDSTQFQGVRSLLPNHYLDLRTREVARFGLNDPIGELSVADAAESGASHLSNLMRGAAVRFDLALALTAGWDSRTILAACRSVSVAPHCYTLRFGKIDDRSQDIAVPKQILANLKWDYQVIDCNSQPTPAFVSPYKANTDPAHDEACQLAFALWKKFPKQKVTLSGHCSEIARNFYRLPNSEISPNELAMLTGMDPTDFVLEQFARWIEGARKACESSGISLFDLFYWEQRAGRWAANGQSQWDLVHERFTPFNYRPLLLTLLSTPAKYRKAPSYKLYRRMIRILSPSLLSYPINPESNRRWWTRGSLRRMYATILVGKTQS